eukprot:3929910-Pleurochrysis_carterae.AAC.2
MGVKPVLSIRGAGERPLKFSSARRDFVTTTKVLERGGQWLGCTGDQPNFELVAFLCSDAKTVRVNSNGDFRSYIHAKPQTGRDLQRASRMARSFGNLGSP